MVTLVSHASEAVAAAKVGVAEQLIGVTTDGQVILGGVISLTTTVLLQVEVLPQSSVAIHVRVTLKLPGQLPGVVTSLNVMATLVSHASEAVAAAKVGVAEQLIGVTTDGQVILGGVISLTTTVRLQVEVLPQSSVAVHVRVTL